MKFSVLSTGNLDADVILDLPAIVIPKQKGDKGDTGGLTEDQQVLFDEVTELALLPTQAPYTSFPVPDGLVVRVPSQYPTVQQALDATYGLSVPSNSTVTVLIESGHRLTHGWSIRNGDWGHYRIASEDAVVNTVLTNFNSVATFPIPGSFSGIMFYENCKAPRLSCIIRGNVTTRTGANVYDGLMCYGNVDIHVDPECGVQNCRINCEIRQGSRISARSTDWSDAILEGMRITAGCTGSISSCIFNRCQKGWSAEAGDSLLSSSVHISRGSFVQAQDCQFNESGCIHVNVRRGKASLIGCTFGTKDLVTGISRSRMAGIMEGGEIVISTATTYLGNSMVPTNFGINNFNITTGDGLVCYSGSPGALEQIVSAAETAIISSILPSNPAVVYQIQGRTRYPDGVLRVWGSTEATAQDMNTPIGALFQGVDTIRVDFPGSTGFLYAPVVQITNRNSNPGGTFCLFAAPEITGFNVRFASVAPITNGTIRFMWEAIGRWK